MKWQRDWSSLTLFLVAALIKFFLFNLTRSLTMYFNVLRKPTFPPELYGCPVRLRYHTPFFWQYVDIISGVHGRGGNMSVLLLEPTGRESSAHANLKRQNINLILTN